LKRTPCVFGSIAAALAVLTIPASAQNKIDVTDLENHPFAVDFPSGARLHLHLRSGDFHIVGRDDKKISVHLDRNAYKAQELRVRFERSDTASDLTVSGGPRNDLEVTIEIPRNTNLFVRMPAGNLELQGITGDKDAELHAGELVIDVGKAADYSRVDASVTSGGLEAAPFGESHGGLFRSFHKEGTGKYHLHAHVGAGDLTLQ
jgi:hypothetical protein